MVPLRKWSINSGLRVTACLNALKILHFVKGAPTGRVDEEGQVQAATEPCCHLGCEKIAHPKGWSQPCSEHFRRPMPEIDEWKWTIHTHTYLFIYIYTYIYMYIYIYYCSIYKYILCNHGGLNDCLSPRHNLRHVYYRVLWQNTDAQMGGESGIFLKDQM